LDGVYRRPFRPGDYDVPHPIPEHDPKCPNCGHPFDSDEWDVRHLSGGPSLGEDWYYSCPKCNNETLECGI
jgi:5-methylcytosine-specific restriction endonuclease McrA